MSETMPSTLPRILIVDDSRMVRATIVKLIRGRFEVREEGDGEAGWQTLMLDPSIQVLLSDLSMPKLDGYGLLQRVRESTIARIREMPVIMISGDEDESARHRAKELGATDFITKGIGTSELLARLDALVKLAQTRNELQAMSKQVMVDPESGLPTEEYLKQQGRQALALAQRWGASLENMEGAAFARACLALGVRGAELRAIANPAGVREKAHWRTKEALSALARAVRRLLAEEGGARRPPG